MQGSARAKLRAKVRRRSALSLALLMSLVHLSLSPNASAMPVQLDWVGLPDAASYELQTADDARFARGLHRMTVDSASKLIDLPSLPRFARIRAIYPKDSGERPSSDWFYLPVKRWGAPRLAKSIEVPADEAGKMTVEWQPPKGADGDALSYRVRVTSAKGEVVHDAIVEKPRFLLPRIPGGYYQLEVEVLGAPDHGSLHALNPKEDAASAQIVADELPYDPKAYAAERKREREEEEKLEHKLPPTQAEKPRDLLGLTDPFAAGLIIDSELGFQTNSYLHRVDLTERLRLTGESGVQFGADVPLVLLEGGDFESATGTVAPRLGGNPYPELSAGFRVAGGSRNSIGARATLQLTTDTADRSQDVPNAASFSLVGRVTSGQVSVDWEALLASTFSKSLTSAGTSATLRHVATQGIAVAPGFLMRPDLRVALALGVTHQGAVAATTSTTEVVYLPAGYWGTIEPEAQLQLSRSFFAHGGLRLGIGPDTPDPRARLLTGVTLVF